MTEVNQHLEEDASQDPTLEEERGSEEASKDLDDLFEDDSNDDSQEDAPVTREELKRLEKGIQNLASQLGRQSKEPKERVETKDSPSSSSVLKNLYMKANPEAQEVWEDVEKEAKLLGKDPFELYEASSYFKGEAKARIEAKKVEEESRRKIEKPSSDTASTKTDLDKIKPEDVVKLKPSEKLAWMKRQAEKEKSRID